MQVILYNQLNPQSIPNFQKMKGFLETGDFRSADVKKVGHNLYRARLDISNRLLFSLYRSHDHTYILVLECIAHHAYNKSVSYAVVGRSTRAKSPPWITRIRPQLNRWRILIRSCPPSICSIRCLSFDDAQQAVYTLPPPA